MNKSEYKIIISEKAMEMLSTHIAFIANVSKEAAIKQKNKLLTEIKEISNMPEKYPWLSNELLPANKYHKKIVDKRYIIIYQVKANNIFVDYIIDGRQDYNWLLK